jgi:Na+-driven multidrug efflux pump
MITLHQALGYALPAAVLALVRQGILLVPVVLLLYPFYQFDSLVYGFPLTDFLVLLVTVLMSVKWLRRMELFRAGESMLKS